MQPLLSPENLSVGVPSPTSTAVRPDRPCDACRRRKSRCVLGTTDDTVCVLCAFHKQSCTFVEDALPRKRKVRTSLEDNDGSRPSQILHSEDRIPRRQSETSVRAEYALDDYANLHSTSLLKKTLGLQNHRYARHIGSTSVQDSALLGLKSYDGARGESTVETSSVRKVKAHTYFQQCLDTEQADYPDDGKDLDDIEAIVAPYGLHLVRLYFRIVHPTFPILHKKVYLEKYARSYREFSPPLLAAVYLLASDWWLYSSELVKETKPDLRQLEDMAIKALWRISCRAKLSTVQAGLLLSQRQKVASWPLTCMIVGIAQDLGLHLDCTTWRIPGWERGLRKRLAWAVFMQDIWSASVYGRPPHLSMSNWEPTPVVSSDFPESAADEDDEEGSTEVEKGRALFSAMIALTKILSEVLDNMYSLRAEGEVNHAWNCVETVLAQAKPIQLKLRAWYEQMPEMLRMDSFTRVGKLNSVGYLHLAYYATEMTIHRKVIRAVDETTDTYLVQVCRTAAKSRLVSAMQFVDRLKPEHFQSFWYFASISNFALIGSFAGLCLVTSRHQEEACYYQDRLQQYRWNLKVASNGIDFLKRVSDLVVTVVEPIAMSLSGSLSSTTQTTVFPMFRDIDFEKDRPRESSQHPTDPFLSVSPELDTFLDVFHMHTM